MTVMPCGFPRCARWLQVVQEVGGALRMGHGPEDGPLVVLQDCEPVDDVGCVILTGRERQFEIDAQEGRAKLGHQFFFGIAFVAPCLAPKFTGEAGRVFRPVRGLMGQGGIVAAGIGERIERRRADVIE